MRITYSEGLLGHPVVDAAGHVLGEVDEIFLDSMTWKLSALRVKLRREAADAIGVSRGAFRSAWIEIPCEVIQSVSDAVVLHKDASSLVPHDVAEPQPIEQSPPPPH